MKKLSRSKGFKITPNGQWEFPGENTLIPSNQITMKGVPYPVFGMDDTGYSQMMYPGMEYTYPGSMVYEIPMAQDGKQTGVPDFNKLYNEYKAIQSQINQYIGNNEGGKKEQEYRLKLNDLANKLVEEGVSIENTDYVPQHIKQDSKSHYCIGSSCYILNQAGEDFKYFSNSNFQDDVIAGKVPGRTFDYSAKGVVPGDIIQFKRSQKGSPYHAYLIQDISAPDKDGNRKVIAVGSAGSGPMQNKEYTLTKDNKITSEYDGVYDVQTIRRERFDKDIAPKDLLKKRDALKADLEKYYPNYKVANIDEKVVEVNDDPNAIYDSRTGTAFEWNQKNEIYSPATKEINLEDSKINEILGMFSSPDFKKQFLTTQNVSSEEYDAIIKNVMGIYGQETKFGTRKEAPDFIAKSFPGLVSSVGPFQINPKNLKTQKFSREDLFDPIKGAEAAAIFLAENLPLLRNRSNAKPGTDTYSRNITKDNYLEYLPYLMNDQRVIRRGDYKNIEKGFPIVQGKSDYKERVDNYIKMLGLESIPISRPAPEYQSGGTFNPDTDEFIGFVDDLPQAQEGKQTKLKRRNQSSEDDVLLGPTLQPFEVEEVRSPGDGLPLASGRTEPTMGPIEAMLFAPAASSMLSSVVPRVGSSLMTGLGRSLPGMSTVPGATYGNLLGAYGATDAMVNRIPYIPGQLSRGEYGDALANTLMSGLDISGANMISPLSKGAGQLVREQIYNAVDPFGYGVREKILNAPATWARNTFNPSARPKRIGSNFPTYYGQTVEELGKNRLDAWRLGLNLNQKYNTFQPIGNNTYKIKRMNPNPDLFNDLYTDILSNEIKKGGYYFGDDALINASRRNFLRKIQNANYSNDITSHYKHLANYNQPWKQVRIVEKSKNPNFTNSIYDADTQAIMGNYRWDVKKLDNGNIHFQSNDTWDINPWEKRGSINLDNTVPSPGYRKWNPLSDLEFLNLVGGKKFNIQNNFEVDPKTYKIINSYKDGGMYNSDTDEFLGFID